jgi:hypothetical protein
MKLEEINGFVSQFFDFGSTSQTLLQKSPLSLFSWTAAFVFLADDKKPKLD